MVLFNRFGLLLALCAAPLAHAALTVNADGTVTDTTTGLVWDRCVLGTRTSAATTCAANTNATYTWANALAQVSARNTASHLGFSDWRVPNKNELESIVKRDVHSPAIDTTAFPNTPPDWTWTSTTYTPDPALAWVVVFGSGSAHADGKSNLNFVRLVRSGQSFSSFDSLLPVVNGSCGSAHATTPLVTSAPSGGALCTTGTAGSVTSGTSAFTWSCAGSNGGSTASCSASRGYTVTPSAGANGSISPSGAQVVAYNATAAFTVAANAGYTASVGGSCSGALSGSTFTTGPVTAACGVSASFGAAPAQVPDAGSDSAPAPTSEQVPSLAVPGAVAGDGNGDGVADVNQLAVRSVQVRHRATGASTWLTLVAGGTQGKAQGSQLVVRDMWQDTEALRLPLRMTAPLGQVWFGVATLQAGAPVAFSLYVDTSLGANGFWRQNRAGIWVNLASPAYGGRVVAEGGRLRLDFVVQDGDEFDADGVVNGTVTMPGVVGNLPQSSTAHRPQLTLGGNSF